jgi:hypothetical protein
MEAQIQAQCKQLFCDRNNTEMQNLKLPFGTAIQHLQSVNNSLSFGL